MAVQQKEETEEPQKAPNCPVCGKVWEEHNLARVRQCITRLEEALDLAEDARIRASLTSSPSPAHRTPAS